MTMNLDEDEKHLGKKWQDIINGFFSVPSILVLGALLIGHPLYALAIAFVFYPLLLFSGVFRIFSCLPPLTRIMLVATPVVFFAGWIISRFKPGTLLIVLFVGVYGAFVIASNLAIPKYMSR